MQVRRDQYTNRSIEMQETMKKSEADFRRNMKRFFKLFKESTSQGSQAAAGKMTEQ
jgi:hypothetical protein